MEIDTEVTGMISRELPVVPLDVDVGDMKLDNVGDTTVDMTGRPIEDMITLGQSLKHVTWRNLSNDDLLAFLIYYKNPNVESLDISRQDSCREGELLIAKKGLPDVFVSEHL